VSPEEDYGSIGTLSLVFKSFNEAWASVLLIGGGRWICLFKKQQRGNGNSRAFARFAQSPVKAAVELSGIYAQAFSRAISTPGTTTSGIDTSKIQFRALILH
jgi:hypothetical protein